MGNEDRKRLHIREMKQHIWGMRLHLWEMRLHNGGMKLDKDGSKHNYLRPLILAGVIIAQIDLKR